MGLHAETIVALYIQMPYIVLFSIVLACAFVLNRVLGKMVTVRWEVTREGLKVRACVGNVCSERTYTGRVVSADNAGFMVKPVVDAGTLLAFESTTYTRELHPEIEIPGEGARKIVCRRIGPYMVPISVPYTLLVSEAYGVYGGIIRRLEQVAGTIAGAIVRIPENTILLILYALGLSLIVFVSWLFVKPEYITTHEKLAVFTESLALLALHFANAYVPYIPTDVKVTRDVTRSNHIEIHISYIAYYGEKVAYTVLELPVSHRPGPGTTPLILPSGTIVYVNPGSLVVKDIKLLTEDAFVHPYRTTKVYVGNIPVEIPQVMTTR